MNLAASDEQLEMASSVDRLLAASLPIDRVRQLADDPACSNIDAATWGECAALGVLSMGVPVDSGGLGLGVFEQVFVFRELGRHVTPGPFRSSVLALHVAWASGDDDLVAALASGARRAGIASGDLAVDAEVGDLLLRVGERSATLVEVVSSEPVGGVDPGLLASRVATGPTLAESDGSEILSRARVLVAAELLGITEAVRDMSATYAQDREQFGRPIGSFQAVKHRCADMAIGAYATLAQVLLAARYLDINHPEAAFHAASACVVAIEVARRSTADNIQNHGAIGFTMEHDAHLFLRRAFVLEHLLGPPRDNYRAVLEPDRHEFS